jgi:prephenate dehydrogenase
MSAGVERALVVGCGLIGTSVALALRDAGVEVHVTDANPDHVELAVSVGAGLAEPVSDPDVVIVAVPPAATIAAVREALLDYPDAIVTDVASVKSAIVASIDDPRFVSSHPMAGKERSGPMAASSRLFEGRPWAVVPGAATSPESVAMLEQVIASTGAVIKHFDAQGHDRAVGLVSHIPHLVSVLMAGLLRNAPDEHLELAGQGLRDVTRIAGSDTGLWIDILLANHEYIRGPLEQLREDLEAILGPRHSHDDELLGSVLDRGRAGTRRIPGRHGDRPEDFVSVFVPIDDSPGQLSALFALCSDAGVNVEDLRIDHELGREVGLVEIVVVPASADRLENELVARGWAAYQ